MSDYYSSKLIDIIFISSLTACVTLLWILFAIRRVAAAVEGLRRERASSDAPNEAVKSAVSEEK